MNDEAGFLSKVLENPADDTTRLVYADWLDEQGTTESKAKALFLRLTASLLDANLTDEQRDARRTEMQPLAAVLPTDWLAVVSRLKVEMCAEKRADAERQRRVSLLFNFVCDLRWDELQTTDNEGVRSCERCKENVHYCDTITAAREHAQKKHCVAVDLGIIRHEGDLSPPVVIMGKPSIKSLERAQAGRAVDDVSREREARKREGS